MKTIDEIKQQLHNTSLYAKGHDFDSTKRAGGLYDVLEQLRPQMKTPEDELYINYAKKILSVGGVPPNVQILLEPLYTDLKDIENKIKELEK